MILLITGGIILIASITGFSDWEGLNTIMPGLGSLMESTLGPIVDLITAIISEFLDFIARLFGT